MMQEQKIVKIAKLVLASGIALSVIHSYAEAESSPKAKLEHVLSSQPAKKDDSAKEDGGESGKIATSAPIQDANVVPQSGAQTAENSSKVEGHQSLPPSRYDISRGFSEIAEKVVPAVVNVSTTQIIDRRGDRGMPQFPPGSPFDELFKEFFDQMERPRRVTSLGSGFIVKSDDASAYIVTNYHVVADAKEITVFLNTGEELKGAVFATDERTDIVLVKVKTDTLPPDRRKLPTVEWGDSNKVKVGDWVLAIGNPFGLGSTVTSGIISNRSRDIGMRASANKNRVSEYVDDFMQHDASINMGNSGGPLFNLDGKVIGINTAIFSPSGGNVGIGFAIPSAVAADTVKQLIEFGRTKRGWLGVRIQMVTEDVAESLGLGKAHGAIVGKVTPNGPAANGGIEPGDIIIEFDGKEIGDKTRLSRVVGETEVGKKVKVKLWRKGKEITTEVVLGEFETSADGVQQEPSKADKGTSPATGIEVLGIRVSESKRHDLKDQKGVIVTDVDPESTASSLLQRGDIILEVNQKEVNTPQDFKTFIEEAKKLGRKHVLLLVSRQGEVSFVTIRLEAEEDNKEVKNNKKLQKK